MRTLLLLTLCAALCASCSGGTTSGFTPDDEQHLSLTVLPESFELGGAADTSLTARPEAGGLAVDINASATDLKAFYFDLVYDETQWHPVSVEQHLGADDATLELAVTSAAGTVHGGRVLAQPQEHYGISGELTLATVHFAPGGCDAARTVSDPPDKDGSKPVLNIDAAGVLTWKYANVGDYDQNRECNAADLTPLAIHLTENTGGAGAFPYDTIESVVDGDSNGEINIADITPIAANLLNTVSAYRIYRSQSTADYPASNTAPPVIAHLVEMLYDTGVGAPTQVRLDYSKDVAPDGGNDPANIFWVRAVDSAGNCGSPSNQVNGMPPANAPPNISAFVSDTDPMISATDANLTATATDPDGDPLDYSYSATAGTVDDTGTDTTIFHAPTVLVSTQVTITVTVDDGHGHTPSRNVIVTVDPEPVSEVHVDFSPVAEGGDGTTLDAYGLNGVDDYTFTATDQNGNDITSETTFDYANDELGSVFPQGMFTGNVFSTNVIGNGTFNVVGTYREGQPDEVVSDPEFSGEESHFTIVFTLP